MATISPTITKRDHYASAFWETLTESDTAAGWQLPRPTPMGSIYVSGTFGSATVALQGSLDGSNWFGLTDPSGTAITFTAAGGSDAPAFPVLWVRPSASGGSSQDVDVTILALLGPERSA